MERLIIGIVGVERSGKDTIADYFVDKYGFKKYSLAKPIKTIASQLFGWPDDLVNGPEKDVIDRETGLVPRDFIVWLGTNILQYEVYNRFPQLESQIPKKCIWAKMMSRFIDNNPDDNIIIPDIRFIHEADELLNKGGVLIRISRTDKETEQQLAKYDLPILFSNGMCANILTNNGTIAELHGLLDEFISHRN